MAHLDDPALSETDLASYVERFAETLPTGGTAIDECGTICLSDVDAKRIITISPEGKIATLVADPRLIWVDAMWIEEAGNLLLPAPQLNRIAPEWRDRRRAAADHPLPLSHRQAWGPQVT